MPIISISLNENIIQELDKLQKFLGFSGRSEIVRASVRNLLLEEKRIDELSGVLHSVLLVIHDEKSDQEISEIRHGFDKIINTHIHNKIDKDRCLEIFVLYGDAREIKNITKKFQGNRKMDQVRLVVT
ncbi:MULTISPECIES: CopG family ribbon-helix-helix protein [Candidatus Nitrosocosmicus]|uniref:Nickel-responsive regulator n=2 Tax=Candidatus Nitrosocosmicus TaxID=1826864 RepID=A0A654LTV0_9ARCH|nr:MULTISPECIES: CopG family ribbon-helix-helix protein [Nitrosocosmicus]MBA2268584.1 CopG family ribbon-helix-helix protein [Nitrosopumilus sp.]MDN5847241.1 CopG family ribbon-helix-helix protein [Candidatus Nitrosocosmicus sp.]MDQ3084207.1 CopG family ribbon-helix-helix protein [Thermoproteota archaeon]ALI34814.1 Putative nickel-responsive regulator [Candidatus Nitrosocosmicus oleophilus]MDN5868166.1 CopG family ribbon-helix-helix protein [Candidatus Nitrosocosmicus sp.]